MIIKMSDVETHITPKSVDIGDIGCRFYTEDENTAFIRIRINYHGEPVDLTKTDMKPRLDLFMQDDSKFIDEKLEVLIPENGLVQYSIPPNVIKHAGRTKCKLFMMDNEKSIHVANFFFNIVDSGVEEAVSKEINLNLVEDTVKQIMSEDLVDLLNDGFKDKLTSDLENYLSTHNEEFKGPKGEQGEQGIQGPKGDKGDTVLVPPKIYTRDEYNQLETKDDNTLYFISEV
ncbi:phage baseplate upper protein [Staphylococcus delphini]|uniref:phage baseplate upper protein n=1 Tax=Staphylococcus delphini TaxID=53344 RepID=UPI00336510AF